MFFLFNDISAADINCIGCVSDFKIKASLCDAFIFYSVFRGRCTAPKYQTADIAFIFLFCFLRRPAPKGFSVRGGNEFHLRGDIAVQVENFKII